MVLPVGALLAVGLVCHGHAAHRLAVGIAVPGFGRGSQCIVGLHARGAFSPRPNPGPQNLNGVGSYFSVLTRGPAP